VTRCKRVKMRCWQHMIYVKLLYAGQVEGHDVVLLTSKTSANKIYKVG
jgi:hypothetical protein